jgi:hypothetical protein
VWIIDPASRVGWVWDRVGMRELTGGVFQDIELDITMPLAEIFSSIDED